MSYTVNHVSLSSTVQRNLLNYCFMNDGWQLECWTDGFYVCMWTLMEYHCTVKQCSYLHVCKHSNSFFIHSDAIVSFHIVALRFH